MITATCRSSAALAAPVPGGMVKRFRLLTAGVTFHTAPTEERPDGVPFVIPEAVLQSALALFDGVPVKLDHSRGVLATVGRVVSPTWSPATPERPAGIDADLSITLDTEDGRTVAALLAQDLIRCGSSGFGFEADAAPDAEGRLVASRICRVREYSLVDEGADPYSARLAAGATGGMKMNEKQAVAAVLAFLGLAPDTSMEEFVKAVGKLSMGKDPSEDKPEEPKPEMPAPPAPDAAQAQLAQLCAVLAPEGKTLTPDQAVVEAIRLRTEFVPRSAVPSQVDVALAERRIAPFEVAALRRMEGSAPDALRAYLATRKPGTGVPSGERQAQLSADETAPPSVVSARAKELAKLAGLPETAAAEIEARLGK